jgi:hypothetical protein
MHPLGEKGFFIIFYFKGYIERIPILVSHSTGAG